MEHEERKRKLSPEEYAGKVYSQYTQGLQFNNQLNLVETVENNENFFIGKGLPM